MDQKWNVFFYRISEQMLAKLIQKYSNTLQNYLTFDSVQKTRD